RPRRARGAGAPRVAGAGVAVPHKGAPPAARGPPLYRIHAASRAELDFARRVAEVASGYTIGAAATAADPLPDF
ncbi:MAG: thymidine phosphorylase, partial [Betaproteobacteria bacterium]